MIVGKFEKLLNMENFENWTKQQLLTEIRQLRAKIVKLEKSEIKKFSSVKIEDKIKQTEDKWKAIIENSPDHIMLLDTNYMIKYINHTVPDFKKEQVIGKSILSFIPEKFQKIAKECYNRVIINGKADSYKTKYISSVYGTQYYEVRISPMKDSENRIIGFISTSNNITKRQQAEEAINLSEKKYKSLLDNMTDGYYRSDNKLDILLHSSSVEKITGFNGSEIHGRNISKFFANPKDSKTFIEQLKKNGSVEKYPAEIVAKDGNRIFIETNSRVYYDDDGNFNGIEGIFYDITKRKQSELALRLSEERMRSLIDQLPISIQILDLNGKTIRVNKAWEKLWGVCWDEFAKTENNIFENESTKSKHLEQYFKKAYLGESVSIPAMEYNIGKTNEIINKRWLKSNIYPIKDKVGNIINIILIQEDITERKQTQEALLENEKLLRKIAENYPNSFLSIIEKDYTVGFTSGQEFIKQNIDPEQYVGLKLEEVFGDSTSLIKEYYKKTFDGKECSFELFIYNQYQHYRTVPLYAEDGTIPRILSVVENITERKKAEEEIRKLSTAVEQSPSVIAITDIEGNFEYVNPKFTELSGYSAEEVIGKNPRIQKTGSQSDKVYEELWKTISSGNIWRGEFHNKKKNGDSFWEAASLSPIFDNSGKIINYIKVAEDITKRKQAEEALKQHAQQLQERNEELDDFSHTVAHDLKNPLGGIIGFTDILYSKYFELSDDAILNYLKIIFQSSIKMNQIIDSLLLLASVRKSEIKLEKLDMTKIIAESIKRLTPLIEETKTKIKFPKSWPNAMGYLQWVEEVWVNYLSNAIKYGGESSQIEIGADYGKSKNIGKGMVRFWVRDYGPGISEENQKLLFNKFERLDQVKTEGHGLGLSIVRRIIEKQGGQVGVESKAIRGEGSLFYFSLPSTGETKKQSEFFNGNFELSKRNKSMKLKILIAEDEESANLHISIILKSLCREILHAKTGLETVELCINNPDIDLILMDIKMPEMNGYEATRQIRRFNKTVYIIAQTAYALHSDREKVLNAGCDEYITKPINKNELIKMIVEKFDGN